jgi:hypothetical protein
VLSGYAGLFGNALKNSQTMGSCRGFLYPYKWSLTGALVGHSVNEEVISAIVAEV